MNARIGKQKLANLPALSTSEVTQGYLATEKTHKHSILFTHNSIF